MMAGGMRNWFEDLPGVSGADALTAALLQRWPDRAMDGRLQDLRFCPVVASELYQVARFLPVTVVAQPGGVMVMVDLRPDILRRPAFGADGSYQRSYRPMVSRLLPFVATRTGGILRLRDDTQLEEPQRPPELQRQIGQMLTAQAAGLRMLTAAADLLLAAGLLVEVEAGEGEAGEGGGGEYRPLPHGRKDEAARLAAGLPAQADGFLALRLLAVLEFSDLHRQEYRPAVSDAESLRVLSGRNEALRRQTFLIEEELLDFSGLQSPAPIAVPTPEAGSDASSEAGPDSSAGGASKAAAG